MKLLELFSGTGSVGKVAKELGYDVVSLDLKMPTSIPTSSIGITNNSTETIFKSFGLLPLVLNIASPKPLVLEK